MTAAEIQLSLMKFIRSTPSDIIVPNYYVGYWEMDVCKVTKVGQMTEYEIKVSKADYKKEWEKSCMAPTGEKVQKTLWTGYVYEDHVLAPQTKHSQVQAGNRCNRFYFVCPAGLIKPEEVPKGYGLIWVKKHVHSWGSHTTCEIVKRSSLWTKEPQPIETFRQLAVNISAKYWNARSKIMSIQEGARRNKTKEV